MKLRLFAHTLFLFLLVLCSAQASNFDGFSLSAKGGSNRSDISGGTLQTGLKSTSTWGVGYGYNWAIDHYVLGFDFASDLNHAADHPSPSRNYASTALDLALKAGIPIDNWMPFVQFGFAYTKAWYDAQAISGIGLIRGVGIEYKLSPKWSMNAQWFASSASANGSRLNNENATVGLRYYIDTVGATTPISIPQNRNISAAKASVSPSPVPVSAPAIASVPVQSSLSMPVPASSTAIAPIPSVLPQKKESWKVVLTEKPSRLEGPNFKVRSAKFLKSSESKMEEVLIVAAQHPEIIFEVSGHTDNQNKLGMNQSLSTKRADAVKSWLIAHGIAPERITSAGYADTQPIADNRTKVGRAANRRVEVRYTLKEEKKIQVVE